MTGSRAQLALAAVGVALAGCGGGSTGQTPPSGSAPAAGSTAVAPPTAGQQTAPAPDPDPAAHAHAPSSAAGVAGRAAAPPRTTRRRVVTDQGAVVILPPPPRRKQLPPESDCESVRAADLDGNAAQLELPPRPGLAARRVSDASAEIVVTTEAAPTRCAVGHVAVTLDSNEDVLPGVIELIRVDPAAPTTRRLTLTLRPGSGRADVVRATGIGVDVNRESQTSRIGIR